MKPIQVRRYSTERLYERDARRMAKRGYTVADVTSERPNAGCMRWLTLGIFALFFKPKPVLIVTYKLN